VIGRLISPLSFVSVHKSVQSSLGSWQVSEFEYSWCVSEKVLTCGNAFYRSSGLLFAVCLVSSPNIKYKE
ncbi:hypothetical protein U1Q18_035391, partial [Sarracenia purpurea var. burkii]